MSSVLGHLKTLVRLIGFVVRDEFFFNFCSNFKNSYNQSIVFMVYHKPVLILLISGYTANQG